MRNLWRVFEILSLWTTISANANFTGEIYKLANEIYRNYFQVFKCVTYAADDVTNADYLEKTLPMFVISLSENLDWDVFTKAFEQGCGGFVVQTKMENRQASIQALINAKNQAVGFRYNRERYLFLPVSDEDRHTDVLLEDFMFFLPNFLLVSSEANGKFLINSHTIFDPGEGDKVEVLDAWVYSKGFEHGVDLYPDKIKNVRGKELLLGLMHYVPYSVIVKDGNRTIYDGVETRIAVQFVETINGSYDGFDHPVEMWGNKFPNGSGNGIFGSVQRHRVDLGYSAIYQWYCDVLDCSYPYIQAEVICLVPKPKVLANWMTIFLPFGVSTWVGISTAYLLSCCFVLGINLASRRLKGTQSSNRFTSIAFQSAYNLFRLQLQQIPKLAHKNHPVAVFLRISLFYYYTVSLFWQGGIASILTVPRYEKPIDTASEMLSRWPKLQWGANHDVWIHSIENSTDPILFDIVQKFQVLDEDTLVRRTRTQDFAYFLEKLPNKHYGFSEYINEDTVPHLRLMKNNIYTAFAVMILPRGSPYVEKLDHVIHWLFATGITQKMEIQVSLERINNHLQNMIRFSDEKRGGQAILTVAHIQGSIYIYFGGVIMSVIALIAEKFSFSRKTSRKNKKWKRVKELLFARKGK